MLTMLCIVVSFKLYDVDHDGYLTRPELERVMLQLVGFIVCSSFMHNFIINTFAI